MKNGHVDKGTEQGKNGEPRGMTLKEAIDAIYVYDSTGMVDWRTMGRRGKNNYTKLANGELRAAYRKGFSSQYEQSIFAKLDKEFSMIPDTEPYVATGIISAYGTDEKDLPDDMPSEESSVRMSAERIMKPMEVEARKEMYLPTGMDTKLRSVRTRIRKAMRAEGITAELRGLFDTFLAEGKVLGVLQAMVKGYAGMDSRPVGDVQVYGVMVDEINELIGAYAKGNIYEDGRVNV